MHYKTFLDCFPSGFVPTEQQKEILTELYTIFYEENKSVAILNAPTGSGKSFISKTIGNYVNDVHPDVISAVKNYKIYGDWDWNEDFIRKQKSGGVFILTLTKSLQNQYKELFNISSFKGKNNYACALDVDNTVETAPCIYTQGLMHRCWSDGICPYYNARNDALTSKITVLNYSVFLSMSKELRNRQFIICDEASELEDAFVKHNSCVIDFSKLKKLKVDVPPVGSIKKIKWDLWLVDVSESINNKLSELTKKMKSSSFGTKQIYRFLWHLNTTIKNCLKYWDVCEYVVQPSESGDQYTFNPLYVHPFMKDLMDAGTKILLMSATLIDPHHYAKVLGISPSQYKYFESKSVFDPKKAPIFCHTKYSLNYNNLKTTLPNIIKLIKKICDEHKNEKGIIHTHTNFITNEIQNFFRTNKRFLCRDDNNNNEDILNEHIYSDKPTILVSPSLTHGIDLKEDLARFQIIVKAPFYPLGDKRTKTLFERDKTWYCNKMLSNVIQAAGRGNRSINDYCVTYILDKNIVDTFIRYKHKLPKYFIDRIQ